jgi:hypothetical protein
MMIFGRDEYRMRSLCFFSRRSRLRLYCKVASVALGLSLSQVAVATLSDDPECRSAFAKLPPAAFGNAWVAPDTSPTIRLPNGHLRIFARIIPLNVPAADPLSPTLSKNGKSYIFERTAARSRMYFVDVPQAEDYLFSLRDGRGVLIAPQRILSVNSEFPLLRIAYLRKGEPYYRMGNTLVPFVPQYRFLSVFFPFASATISATEIASRAAAEGLPVKPASPPLDKSFDFVMLDNSVWIFELTDITRREETITKLQALIDVPVRIGVPLQLHSTAWTALDTVFVVQFASSASAALRSKWLKTVNATYIRSLEGDSSFSLIRFHTNDYCVALIHIENAIGTILDSGEPDLMVVFVDADAILGDWPNDPKYSADQDNINKNHRVQRIRDAWRLMREHRPASFPISPPWKLPDVYIGSADRGVDESLEDVSCDPPTLIQCANFRNGTPFTCGNVSLSHGTHMYGVMSACTNNDSQVAAVAPNVRHIAVNRPKVSSFAQYRAMLLWLGGLRIDCPDYSTDVSEYVSNQVSCADLRLFPRLRRPADVINASHTLPANVPEIPVGLRKAYFQLATHGSRGRGTVIVYAAGNESCNIDDYEPLANDPFTMAIANCWINDSTNMEERFPGATGGCRTEPNEGVYFSGGSNWGSMIDICALGKDTPTVCVGNACVIGGTSAAAATVSGIVALLRSVNKNLSAEKIRHILRQSADKIDENPNHPDGLWVDGRSQWYGSGRLNGCKAIAVALSQSGIPIEADQACN